jgi:hypothetical protein
MDVEVLIVPSVQLLHALPVVRTLPWRGHGEQHASMGNGQDTDRALDAQHSAQC